MSDAPRHPDHERVKARLQKAWEGASQPQWLNALATAAIAMGARAPDPLTDLKTEVAIKIGNYFMSGHKSTYEGDRQFADRLVNYILDNAPPPRRSEMSEEQIAYMVAQFLGWTLPKDFGPDNGISVKPPNYAPEVLWELSGTNLFDATQATAMVRHMVKGMPADDCITAENARLREALERWRSFGCPDCGGDCASANPPVNLCIMRETYAALRGDV